MSNYLYLLTVPVAMVAWKAIPGKYKYGFYKSCFYYGTRIYDTGDEYYRKIRFGDQLQREKLISFPVHNQLDTFNANANANASTPEENTYEEIVMHRLEKLASKELHLYQISCKGEQYFQLLFDDETPTNITDIESIMVEAPWLSISCSIVKNDVVLEEKDVTDRMKPYMIKGNFIPFYDQYNYFWIDYFFRDSELELDTTEDCHLEYHVIDNEVNFINFKKGFVDINSNGEVELIKT